MRLESPVLKVLELLCPIMSRGLQEDSFSKSPGCYTMNILNPHITPYTARTLGVGHDIDS